MQLAKPRVDIGLNTNNIEAMTAFWRSEAGIPFDHVLPIRKGLTQYRHNALGSVVKLNHYETLLPERPQSGYAQLLVARAGVTGTRDLKDPDSNALMLVEPGYRGITQIGIQLQVRDLSAHARFYEEAFGFEATNIDATHATVQAGETVLLLTQAADAPSDATMDGKGWRYITFQIFKVDEEHPRVLKHGGREAMPPTTLGTTARISMVRDPDGNWIELSQRASITGSLT